MTNSTVKKIILIIAVFMLMLAAVLNLGVLAGILRLVMKALKPVIIAFCIAFILSIPLSFFEKHIKIRNRKTKKVYAGLSKAVSLVITILLVIAAIALLLLVIIPQVTKSAQAIVAAFPAFSERALERANDLLIRFDITPARVSELLLGGENLLDKVGEVFKTSVTVLIKQAGTIGGAVVATLYDVIFGIFLAVYFLASKDMIIRQIKRLSRVCFKENLFNRLCGLCKLTSTSFRNFISGQCIEAVILGCLCFVGMLIFRFPYAPIVAVLVGVSALIPIVGAWIGCGISAFLIIIVDPIKAVWFVVFFVILQQLENNLIYPRVVGDRVGLSGVWVLMAVIIGNQLFGAIGALISVPVASVLYAVLVEFVKKSELKKSSD